MYMCPRSKTVNVIVLKIFKTQPALVRVPGRSRCCPRHAGLLVAMTNKKPRLVGRTESATQRRSAILRDFSRARGFSAAAHPHQRRWNHTCPGKDPGSACNTLKRSCQPYGAVWNGDLANAFVLYLWDLGSKKEKLSTGVPRISLLRDVARWLSRNRAKRLDWLECLFI